MVEFSVLVYCVNVFVCFLVSVVVVLHARVGSHIVHATLLKGALRCCPAPIRVGGRVSWFAFSAQLGFICCEGSIYIEWPHDLLRCHQEARSPV